MAGIRKPLEGVGNIIRFNWHYYAISFSSILIILIFRKHFNQLFFSITGLLVTIAILMMTVSLIVSAIIYDFSSLYQFNWLKKINLTDNQKILNINAGFDEVSSLLKHKFPDAQLFVADFFNPVKHTEISIRRARKKYPPYPGTTRVNTSQLPYENDTFDSIFAFLSAHEIRRDGERIAFFRELRRVLKENGKIIVTEHVRDIANFAAYNIGFLHFHSKASWMESFANSNLLMAEEFKITPFITTFILQKNGTPS
jgi:SAM-dependent methyltransferase